jgi:hypothetical protein
MESPTDKDELAIKTMQTARRLKDELSELLIAEGNSPKRTELVNAYKTLLLVIYQIESSYANF